jgi:hypothetical protein
MQFCFLFSLWYSDIVPLSYNPVLEINYLFNQVHAEIFEKLDIKLKKCLGDIKDLCRPRQWGCLAT